ncbi:MAG: hypothetical protein P4L74_04380 [Candidatus Doudnabacteria bacterium]|nr:hypothetical protein [Candidatus Doudnabacteria bacterium]
MDNNMPGGAVPSAGAGKKFLVWVSILLGVAFFVIGYIYVTHSAGSLPSFFPGYSAGAAGIHAKHAIASFVVGIACFIYGWFASGPKAPPST